MRPLTIVPYNPDWPEEFRQISASLRQALGDLALRIDHIGSTAVPGLPAKDVIDVQITVASLEAREPVVEAVTSAGYRHLAHIDRDHYPPGIEVVPAQWQKMMFNAPEGRRSTNVHVRVEGYPNQRYALLFRDYLRAHPAAADAYAEIKRQLARHAPNNWDAYYDVKDPVCDVIMAGAERWASDTAWKPGTSCG